jgi:hypothetical protein
VVTERTWWGRTGVERAVAPPRPWGGGGGGAIEREEEDRQGVTRQGRPSDEHVTGMILSTWVRHISDLMF